MSIKVTSLVWEQSNAKGSDLLVMLYIANRCKDDGSGAYPSIGTIAKACRMSDRTVSYAIEALVKSGELSVEPGSGPHGTHRYTVNFVSLGGAILAGVQNLRGAKSAPGGVQNLHQGGAKSAPNTSVDTTVKKDAANAATRAPRKPSGPAQEIVAEYSRLAGIDAPANYGQAVGHAQSLVKAGVTVQDIPSLFEAASWGDGADLAKMLRQVDRWRAAMNSPSRASPNGQKFLNGQRLLSSADLRRMSQEGKDHDQRGNDQSVIDPEFRVSHASRDG